MAEQLWTPSNANEKYGIAIYNFHANTILHGLSLRIGETVQITEACSDWFKGKLIGNAHRKGIFPRNCVQIREVVLSNPGPYESIIPVVEPVVEEVTSVLREWGNILKELYLEQKTQIFTSLKDTMYELIEYRREIICAKLTQDQQSEIRSIVTLKIDIMNRKLKLDLVPRVDGEIVDADETSVVELFKIHISSSERTNPQVAKRQTGRHSISSGLKTLTRFSTYRRNAAASDKKIVPHHLFMAFKSFMCHIGDASTLVFSLYDIRTSTYISEKYMIKLTKHGMAENMELFGKQFAIFTDLTSTDLLKPVYLVCKIFRQGKLVADSKKVSTAEYRRPFGAGVRDISKILTGDSDEEVEAIIQIYNCNELDYHSIEDFLVNKQTGKYNTFGSNVYSVCVGFKLFHGECDKILKEKGMCALTPRLGFPEVILPGYVRNDFYVTLCKAEFDKGSKSSGKNIEVAMCAVSNRGQVFHDCMFIGSGDKPVSEYHSFVLYHTNSPSWNETIKISLPIEQFHSAHLRFTFSHCSRNEGGKAKHKTERIFGFAFIKLLKNDGTVIVDKDYELLLYKLDNSINFASVQTYLRLASNNEALLEQEKSGVVFAGPQRNNKEYLKIRTFLCSTKLTQNSDIVQLLQWRKMEHHEILDALQSLLKVSPDEVVKFFQDVFDALFNLISENQAEFSYPVFRAVVSITKIVEEVKYEQFKSTLNTYVEEHFSSTLAYKCLVSSLCKVVENASDSKLKATLLHSMQSLVYLIKLIVKSYILHNSAVNNPEVLHHFQELLRGLFQSISKMMKEANDSINESKLEVLKKLPGVCDSMLLVFSEKEFSAILTQIIDAIPKAVNSAVQTQKLVCLQDIVETGLFMEKEARSILMPLAMKNLSFQMERKQELSICLELLGDIITAEHHFENVSQDITLLSSSMLSVILNIILTIDRTTKPMLTMLAVACLLGILKLMEEFHYEQYLENYENKQDLKDFMKKLLVTFKKLLTMDVYPKEWFVLKTLQNNVILTAIQYFSKAFTEYFLEENFDQQLWQSYFQLAVFFLIQENLHLEIFPTSKRETILTRYGDMRLIMGFEVLAMWDFLGAQKKSFIPGLIGPILQMTLIPEQELRKVTIPLFYDMMTVEFAEMHSFKKVEEELIEKLELFMNESKGDLEYEQLFEEIMTKHFSDCRDPGLHEEGLKSVHSITELMKRLLDYRAAKNDDSNNDQKMMCTYRLLEFYENLGRQNMYIRCIYKLVKLHVLCNNFTEAAFTLLLHASLLDWTDDVLPAILDYPKQAEWQRKEQLYLKIIKYFDEGKTWEHGIRLCKELATLYENKIVDYSKLSEILRKQAYFYDNIMKQMRPAPTYFRVSFYGRGFPHYLKDKVLVYRGMELETLAGFTSRINNEFPGAEIMFKNTPPDASIVQGIGQHIQICNVNPIPGETAFEVKNVDEKITSYYRVNEVTQFVYSRPYHKGDKDKNNEFKTLWLERTMHWTKRKFPDILKWSEIESTRKIELTPIENAVESISTKNREILRIIEEYQGNESLNVNRLSMILNGVIDANVNGGVANYQSAFLSEDYSVNNPEDLDKVNHLKFILQEQTSLLSKGIDVHERFVTDSLRPFHERIVMMYSAMKVSIETGQPMEKIMSRPSSLTLNSSLSERSSPKNGSPKSSPHEMRRTVNTPSKVPSEGDLVIKREKIGHGLSSSIQNIFRRNSVQYMSTETSNNNPDSKRAAPPLPPRRTSTPTLGSDFPSPDLPHDIPAAALKRLGLQQAGLTVSAPSLAFIEEEETPKLPPRTYSLKNRSSSTVYEDMSAVRIEVNEISEDEESNGHDESDLYAKMEDVRNSFESLPSDDLADLQNMKIYDNFLFKKEEEFYDSPKELASSIFFTDEAPPIIIPRRASRDFDDAVRTPPARVARERKPSVDDVSILDLPPPLPARQKKR